jgi:hypothetical protein
MGREVNRFSKPEKHIIPERSRASFVQINSSVFWSLRLCCILPFRSGTELRGSAARHLHV